MATATLQSDSSIRKAAVLVRSLDPESVAALLARLSPSEARAVRQAVRELDEITDEERQQVAAELRGRDVPEKPSSASHRAGVELSFSGGYDRPTPAPMTTAAASPPAGGSPWIGKLSHADPEALVSCLTLEQPSTIAVVLTCLPPDRAAKVLSRLPEDLQDRAVNRLAEMGDIDPDSLDVIAAELESWIAQHTRDRRRRDDRRATLRAILDACPSGSRSRLANQLSGRWPELKPPTPAPPTQREEAPRPVIELPVRRPQQRPAPAERPALPFAELESLSGPQLAAVFAKVDRGALLVALFGASEKLQSRLRGVLSAKQQRALEQSLKQLGPVRLSDIAHAQRVVGEAAAALLAPVGRVA